MNLEFGKDLSQFLSDVQEMVAVSYAHSKSLALF